MALARRYDVVIVGGGVMGAACAYWLTRLRPGLSVLMVEKDPSFRRAATALSVASIRQQFSNPVNVQISRFGIEFIKKAEDHLGPLPAGGLGLQENGYLFVTGDPSGAALMEELAAMQRGLGAGTEVLEPEALRARYPWMNTGDLVAGSLGPRDEGWFDNMALLQGLRAAARGAGVIALVDEVMGLQKVQGQLRGVVLKGLGVVSCGAVVVAAGTGAVPFLAREGLALPVEPRKRTVFVIDAPDTAHHPGPPAPLLIDQGYYLRPEGAHWVTATVPSEDGPCDINDFEPDLHLFESFIWERLYNRSESFGRAKVVNHWVGHYDYNTLDQNAILGPHPGLPGLYVMSGFSGHGLQQAPAVGRGLAEHILTGAWQSLDLSPLGVARILEGRPLREKAVV